ncbi:hypothetical protein [Sphingobacterium sp. LRF_L2]
MQARFLEIIQDMKENIDIDGNDNLLDEHSIFGILSALHPPDTVLTYQEVYGQWPKGYPLNLDDYQTL